MKKVDGHHRRNSSGIGVKSGVGHNITIFTVLFALSLVFSFPLPLVARNFRVNIGADLNELRLGDGNCVSFIIVIPPYVSIFCSLRSAVEEANSYQGEDVIELPRGFFNLTLDGRSEDEARTGDLDISESVTIAGKGALQTIIDARQIDRVVDIYGEDTRVTIRDVSLLNGSVLKDGGIIRNGGTLVLEDVVLLGGQAGGLSGDGRGGVLYNDGLTTISYSSLQGGSAREGGALYNGSEGELNINNSIISQGIGVVGGGASNHGLMKVTNSTLSGNGGETTSSGGGLENSDELFLNHVTIAQNVATRGGGISNTKGAYLQNTIVADNRGGNCVLADYYVSRGHNIDSDNSCGFDQETDIAGVDAGLRPLANYGGTTRAHALYPYSPAKDKGYDNGDVAIDQRGVGRPVGAAYDIGAVEYHGFPIPAALTPLLKD